MSRSGKKNGIPDRWLEYKAVGKRLNGTRFVAFKVPLEQSLTRQLPPSQAFGPWELLDAIREDRQELGLIIDLTFTKRYYQPQDLPASLSCVKIFTKGHVVPDDDTILAFKQAVQGFLRDNADNDQLIGVHCTHGLNRTGYMICRYLIDVDRMDPAAAIKLFNSSRGHDMERQNYIDDLHNKRKRSNKGMNTCVLKFIRGTAVARPPDDGDQRQAYEFDRPHHDYRTHGRPTQGRPVYDAPHDGRPHHDYHTHGRPTQGRPVYDAPHDDRPHHDYHTKGRPVYDAPHDGLYRRGRPVHDAPPHGRSTYDAPRHGRHKQHPLPPPPTAPASHPPFRPHVWGPPHAANKWEQPRYVPPRPQQPPLPLPKYIPKWANHCSVDGQDGGAGPSWPHTRHNNF
ncbi:RNA/RNP complex-1-interacting phosphatase isoform X2 [Entelurus aequoreus]|uniref:RNA/RNP complex-1-interacting phosphatase isoform X2 n=1 Tax=Entelurus aequoreus TaxID=161455 RepID=UPI002B1E21E8|nr:RNA/RNP complex-1-interacting phosphatase isoform X2 [Entelurus aequoreus]